MSSGELGTKRVLRRNSADLIINELSVLKKEAVFSTETSVNIYRSIRPPFSRGE
jgi:hypothetical protein